MEGLAGLPAKSQYPNLFAIPRSGLPGHISRTQTHPGISPPVLYSQAPSDANGYQLPCQLLWLELTKDRTSKIGAKRVCSHCFYALVQIQTHEVYDQGTRGSCSC